MRLSRSGIVKDRWQRTTMVPRLRLANAATAADLPAPAGAATTTIAFSSKARFSPAWIAFVMLVSITLPMSLSPFCRVSSE